MGAIDRRLGVDGRDLFGRISAHPRRTLCNGIGQVYYGPVVLITDALSYSATDIFAAGFQDNEVGVVLGTSGNTGAGGANFWSLDDLLRAQKKNPKSPFKTLPKGAEMIVAMRRSIRVGLRAGSPLEEFGVAPDVLHLMTERDVLEDNRRSAGPRRTTHSATAVVPAVGHAGEPQRRARDCGQRRVEGSLVEGEPAISRVDIYVNGRPVRSIDAEDGTVPPTQVAIGRGGNTRTAVEAQAWDRAGRLVAVTRTSF